MPDNQKTESHIHFVDEVAHHASETFNKLKQYSTGEEIASSVLHGLGVVFGIAGMAIMIVFAGLEGDSYKIVASIIYGLAIILEYTASTLYHALTNLKAKHIFKIFDHAAIYLLIAGTYTPYCLVTIRDYSGIPLLIAIWSLALIGIGMEAFWVFRPRWVSVLIYLIMGWLVVFSIRDVVANIEPMGLYLLIAGGLAYTLGTAFYLFKRIPYLHSIWHGWVLAGTVFHYFSILLYVIIPS